MSRAQAPHGLALISSQAFSIVNFRGDLIKAWIAQGIRVYALAPDYASRTREAVIALGAIPIDYPLRRTALSPLHDLLSLIVLVRLLRRLKVEYAFAYFIKPVIYGGIAARLAGVPRYYAMIEGAGYVFSSRSEIRPDPYVLKKLVSPLYRFALKSARKVFFLNQDDMAQFADMRLLRPGQACLSGPIGVDLDAFRPLPLPGGVPVFIMVARLLIDKGVRDYVAAARRLRETDPECRFLLLGGLDENPRGIALEEVEGWVKEGTVEWFGQVEDVRPYLAMASVFVLPTYYREGVPRSIQEAMAMGRPVITTDIPGCRDTIVNGKNGFLIRPKMPDMLLQAMRRCTQAPERLQEMGRASRRMAEARFDSRAQNRRLLLEMGLILAPREPGGAAPSGPHV